MRDFMEFFEYHPIAVLLIMVVGIVSFAGLLYLVS